MQWYGSTLVVATEEDDEDDMPIFKVCYRE